MRHRAPDTDETRAERRFYNLARGITKTMRGPRPWTPERLAKACTLRAEGLSYAVAARILSSREGISVSGEALRGALRWHGLPKGKPFICRSH